MFFGTPIAIEQAGNQWRNCYNLQWYDYTAA